MVCGANEHLIIHVENPEDRLNCPPLMKGRAIRLMDYSFSLIQLIANAGVNINLLQRVDIRRAIFPQNIESKCLADKTDRNHGIAILDDHISSEWMQFSIYSGKV